MRVAEAAVAALGDHDALAGLRQIGQQVAGLFVEHLRALRRLQDDIGAASARAVLAHAVHAGLGLEMLLKAKVDQRVEPVGAFDHDVAAAPAVAAVGAAELDELFPPERDAARPAVAGAHIDAGLIEEFHRRLTATSAQSRAVQSARLNSNASHSTIAPRAGAPRRPRPT